MGMNILYALLYLFLAPVGGGLLAGLDRKLAARMQRRVGPPVVQPFYDVLKLFEKERIAVNEAQGFYLAGFLFFMILSGIFFFAQGDILLVIFTLTMAGICLAVASSEMQHFRSFKNHGFAGKQFSLHAGDFHRVPFHTPD